MDEGACQTADRHTEPVPRRPTERTRAAAELRKLVARLEPGTRLPSVVSLAKQFEVDAATLRAARSILAGEGLVEVVPKAGTYAGKKPIPAEKTPKPHDDPQVVQTAIARVRGGEPLSRVAGDVGISRYILKRRIQEAAKGGQRS